VCVTRLCDFALHRITVMLVFGMCAASYWSLGRMHTTSHIQSMPSRMKELMELVPCHTPRMLCALSQSVAVGEMSLCSP
jgi:hypothetical protein